MSTSNINISVEKIASWFKTLKDSIIKEFEDIEKEFSNSKLLPSKPELFQFKKWDRSQGQDKSGGGGGEMGVIRGNLFEKAGVNTSTVHGEFTPEFRSSIPGTEDSPNFVATGISLVTHMHSPLIPTIHMNTRFIKTGKSWFGGGIDLTPTIIDDEDVDFFHSTLKKTCDEHDISYYPKFKKTCDEYFFIKHRNEPRGVGGIFYDNLCSGNIEEDFRFTQAIGKTILQIYPTIVKKHMYKQWTESQKKEQLKKRARYAEFNLLYDRGTKFGLMTGGNIDAIFMSLPPSCEW